MCVLGGSTVRGRAGHAPHGCGRSGLMWSLSFAGRERDCDKRHNGIVMVWCGTGRTLIRGFQPWARCGGYREAGFAPDGNSARAPPTRTQTIMDQLDGPRGFAPRRSHTPSLHPCLGTFQPDPKSIATRGRPPWRPRCTVAILRSMFTRSCRPRAMQPCQFWSSCHSSRRSH